MYEFKNSHIYKYFSISHARTCLRIFNISLMMISHVIEAYLTYTCFTAHERSRIRVYTYIYIYIYIYIYVYIYVRREGMYNSLHINVLLSFPNASAHLGRERALDIDHLRSALRSTNSRRAGALRTNGKPARRGRKPSRRRCVCACAYTRFTSTLDYTVRLRPASACFFTCTLVELSLKTYTMMGY